jgi:hypothetical protein
VGNGGESITPPPHKKNPGEDNPGRTVLGVGFLSLSSYPCFLFSGLKPGTEYKITVVPMRGDLEGKPILLNGRTGKSYLKAL